MRVRSDRTDREVTFDWSFRPSLPHYSLPCDDHQHQKRGSIDPLLAATAIPIYSPVWNDEKQKQQQPSSSPLAPQSNALLVAVLLSSIGIIEFSMETNCTGGSVTNGRGYKKSLIPICPPRERFRGCVEGVWIINQERRKRHLEK